MPKFGSSDVYIINDISIKDKVINYLYNSLDLSKYRYKMLNDVEQLSYLKNNQHYVSPNFKGYNYFVIFMMIDGMSYCCAIDKKKLSYHRNKLDKKKLIVFKLKMSSTPSVYKGTIFDCKLINHNNSHLMLIKDAYIIMGNKSLTMEMKDKIKYISSILDKQFSSNYCPNFKFKINKLYDYEDLKQLIDTDIPKCKLATQGIIFYPQYSGITIIFSENTKQETKYNNTTTTFNNSNVENTYMMVEQIRDLLLNRKYSYESEGKKKTLTIEKTEITDVYNVYDGKEKIGIAHIPNMKISLYCQEHIIDRHECVCIYNNKFKKWIPLSVV